MTDDSKTIYTYDTKEPIYWLPKDVNNHLDRTTLLFGGSHSGKTTIIEELLYLLKDHVPNYVVIAPRTSDMVYRQKLPSQCIKEDLSKEKLLEIWNRQYHVTQIYNTANDIQNIESLFNTIQDREAIVMVESVKRRATSYKQSIDENTKLDFPTKRAHKEAIDDLQTKKIKEIYKASIRKNSQWFEKRKEGLNPNQLIALEYIDMNPRMCLIIDDSTEKFPVWMKYYKKGEVNPFESIFYKNRWNYLTLIIASHDDKYINPEFRKNSRVTVYTTSQSLITSINRSANGFTNKEKKSIGTYASRIFGQDDTSTNPNAVKTHQKLCYIRDDPHPFRYLIANRYPDYKLGCNPLLELADKMPKKNENISSNPFVKSLLRDN